MSTLPCNLKTPILCLLCHLTGWLAVGSLSALTECEVPQKEGPQPSSVLLLPYFEIDLENPSLTTLFAVVNSRSEPTPIRIAVFSNWGIPLLEVDVDLAGYETRSVNLRDWISRGELPHRTLARQELAHLQASLTGQPSLQDDLFRSTELVPGRAVGFVTIQALGMGAEVLWGDSFTVDPGQDFAKGETLEKGVSLCRRHSLRFLSGAGFDGGTEVLIWTGDQAPSSSSPAYPDPPVEATVKVYSEAGEHLETRSLALHPVQVIQVSDLGLDRPFGWLEIETGTDSFVGARYSADDRYSVGLRASCLSEGAEGAEGAEGVQAKALPGDPSRPRPSSDLLLPYFEVDLENPGLTTLFAVVNSAAHAVPIRTTVFSNWGIPVLELESTLKGHEIRTVNLRDWIVAGNLPDRGLDAPELQQVQGSLSGRRSLEDHLFRSTEFTAGRAVGFVTIQVAGPPNGGSSPRPQVLWGDSFVVDPSQDFAHGEALVELVRQQPSLACTQGFNVCRRHSLRFLSGAGFGGGTQVVIWNGQRGEASTYPRLEDGERIPTRVDVYTEAGKLVDSFQLSLHAVQVLDVGQMGLSEAFGWLDIQSEKGAYVGVRYSAENRYSVGLDASCLPSPAAPL